jgi:hypothetical protein
MVMNNKKIKAAIQPKKRETNELNVFRAHQNLDESI